MYCYAVKIVSAIARWKEREVDTVGGGGGKVLEAL
jgi:hypothetical protein